MNILLKSRGETLIERVQKSKAIKRGPQNITSNFTKVSIN